MQYYYFNPFNKQYYFPQGFKKNKLFNSFYQPYTLAGFLLWFCWRNISVFRNLFIEKKPNDVLPIDDILKHVGHSSVMAFNLGTHGIDQKTTVLGYDSKLNTTFFIKYGTSIRAQNNIKNEAKVLKQLSHLNFVPQLQLYNLESNYSMIKTNVLKGCRLTNNNLNEKIIKLLIEISTQNLISINKNDSKVEMCFTHGDFCPWNLMIDNEKYYVYDWELAGEYLLGYDLFSYIFQPPFLLTPKKSNRAILGDNMVWIKRFFDYFDVKDIKQYLSGFVTAKLEHETSKGAASELTEKYLQLQKDLPNLQL